jgi:7,8-dihydropterin-6-yl-methyl-4-(beta-D-ribofuranosyl)aminobenzene 5'-phosphate synthase
MPTLSRGALEREGFEVIERRQPSLLVGGILITGEVDRVTEFEHGMPPQHQAWDSRGWRHDPAVIDDQALVINVRGRGLVVITGCGHAGVVNIIRQAIRVARAAHAGDDAAGRLGAIQRRNHLHAQRCLRSSGPVR